MKVYIVENGNEDDVEASPINIKELESSGMTLNHFVNQTNSTPYSK